jgi:protein-tyrosine phosphatase
VVTVLLPALAAVLAYLGVTSHAIWLWPAVVLVAAWIVYLAKLPQAFGKRPDGSIPLWSTLAWLPLFAYQWLILELGRRVTGEPISTEVAPGLWVGRRPYARDLPPGVAIVVDLCAEFPVARGVRDGREYIAIPTLDARAPRPDQIARAVDAVLAAPGPAFIHCAHGHGRSATVAAAVLVRKGAATLDDVEAKLKARRPRIGLNHHQRDALAAAARLSPARP